MTRTNSDVLIVGAGLAGFTAAVRASEQGAKVLLIDKSTGELGEGNVLMASGSLRAGGKSPKTAAKELYDFVMAEGVAFPDLVNSWSQSCGRAIDWLQTVGVEIEESAPGRIWLKQQSEISYGPVYKKDVGPRAIASLKRKFVSLGGSYLNGIEGVSLIVENNRVVGLIGKRNGDSIDLRARATILTTGGFAANKELVKQHIGPNADRCKLRGSKQDTGDGLRMALEAGAKAVNLKYFYGHLIARKALTDDRFWPYPRLDSFVDEGVLVDGNGNRFVDEGRGEPDDGRAQAAADLRRVGARLLPGLPEPPPRLPDGLLRQPRELGVRREEPRVGRGALQRPALALLLGAGASIDSLVVSFACVLVSLLLAWTAVYFIPRGVVPLMVRGGEGMTPEAITQMARAWIFWDWFRMAVTLGSYLCFVKAATLQYDENKSSNLGEAV
jgi:glycine/D-amino acid oxidase-like deaminating enzyme